MGSAKLNDWLQVLGMFAIVASLIFVGLQIRQTDAIALSQIYQVGHVTRINISSGRPWEDTAGYSRAVRAGDLFVTSLTSPSAPDGTILYPGDVYRQTREALTIIGDALAEAGLSYADVIKTSIYMRDTARWAEAGRAHAEVFDAVRPALSFIGVSGFFDPRIDVEVEVLAVAAAED